MSKPKTTFPTHTLYYDDSLRFSKFHQWLKNLNLSQETLRRAKWHYTGQRKEIPPITLLKTIFETTGDLYCRKCSKSYKPTTSWEKAEDSSIEQEQWISGICSDKCWDNCSQEEILFFKNIEPIYYSDKPVKTKLIIINKNEDI